MATTSAIAVVWLGATAGVLAALTLSAGCSEAFSTSGSGGTGATTTSASGGRAQGGGGSAQAGNGQGGTAGAENCTNGIDDDADDLIDCADSNCTSADGGYACIAVPAGWSGPLLGLPLQGAPPSCPAPWNTSPEGVVGTNISADPLGCGCNCDPNASIDCGDSVKVNTYGVAACNIVPDEVTLQAGSCGVLTTNGGTIGAVNVVPPSASGSCAGGPPQILNTPPVQYANPRAICIGAATGGGCDSGGVCAPGGGAASALCISHPGDTTCPDASYVRSVVYATWNDTRDCTCNCQPSGPCSAALSLFTSVQNCSGAATVVQDGVCTPLPGGVTSFASGVVSISTPACQPHASALGTVSPTNAITVCCLP